MIAAGEVRGRDLVVPPPYQGGAHLEPLPLELIGQLGGRDRMAAAGAVDVDVARSEGQRPQARGEAGVAVRRVAVVALFAALGRAIAADGHLALGGSVVLLAGYREGNLAKGQEREAASPSHESTVA
jgi:hypothetical protein